MIAVINDDLDYKNPLTQQLAKSIEVANEKWGREIMEEKERMKQWKKEGWQEGHQQGWNEGLNEGLKEGLKKGLKKGVREAEDSNASALIQTLKQQSYSDDQIFTIAHPTFKNISENDLWKLIRSIK